ncbi:sciellin isoform X3 [Epinephelus lanceolatus]
MSGKRFLKDGSWIRKTDEEDEDIDRDPNYAKTVLGSSDEVTSTRTSYVQSISKKFGGSQDDLGSSTVPSSRTSYTKSTYSSLKSDSPSSTTTTTVTKDGKTTETTITTSRSSVSKSPTKTFTERVQSSSKGPQYSTYSPTKTSRVTETTVTSSKDAEDKLYDKLLPSSIKGDYTDSTSTVSKTETVVVKSSPDIDADDQLYKTLIPSSTKDDFSSSDSKTTVSSTETVTVRSSINGDTKTTTTTRTSSTAEDDLYDHLLPKSIKSPSTLSPLSSSTSSITKREIITVESSRGGDSPTVSSPSSTRRTTSYSSYTDDLPSTTTHTKSYTISSTPSDDYSSYNSYTDDLSTTTTRTKSYTISSTPSDDYSSDRKSYSFSRPDSSYEYSSISSPTSYTSKTYRSSRSDDVMTDPVYSSSTKSVYASSERTLLDKDLCSSCRKPFTGDAKMVLDDMKINCHATCFKCEVCHRTLGDMKAGDSLWIYKHMVHCENCFEGIREKWRR